jgi:hypothetical protein
MVFQGTLKVLNFTHFIYSAVDAFTNTKDELSEELDLKTLYELADKKQFPRKEFMLENKIK